MRVAGVPFALATLLAASLSQAQYLISELSFGHAGRISPAEDRSSIPYFTLQGQPQKPEVLSNRIILTPLAPGNQRGAVWSQQALRREAWVADVDFRANGPERGGGNLNIWLAKDGATSVGSSSIYTVGKFDGLVLVVNGHGNRGGMIRGFLNDGTTDYKHLQSIDEQSFGHCSYRYRNLGRPSQIKMRQTPNAFRVEIDGQLCFESDKFSIPPGYNVGITAATPDTPDSFEIFKLVVMSDNTQPAAHRPPPVANQDKPREQEARKARSDGNRDSDFDLPDEAADVFQTSKAQFMDLHNRLQNTNHQLSSVHRSISHHQQQDEKRHEEVSKLLSEVKAQLRQLEELPELKRRIKELEQQVHGMKSDLGRKVSANERLVKEYLDTHHTTLSQTLAESTPGHRFLFSIIIFSQVLVVGAYFLYKRRRNSMPKKYL